MPRKRMLCPDIWTDEGFIELSPLARLLFIGLISHADDHGRGYAGSLALRSKIFPADTFKNGELERLVLEVAEKVRVRFYAVNGRHYYQLERWTEHQYVQKAQDSRIPAPPEGDGQLGLSYQYDSDPEPVPPNRIEKNRKEKKENTRAFAENVALTEEEHANLVATYGPDGTKKLIEKLDNYKGATGKRYKNDYRAILNWAVDALGIRPRAGPEKLEWKCPECGTLHASSYRVCECGYGR